MMDVCSMLVCSMCTAVKIAGSTGTIDARLRPMSKSFIGCVLEVTKDEREQRAPSVFVEFRKCSPCGNSQCSIELIKSGESSCSTGTLFSVCGGVFIDPDTHLHCPADCTELEPTGGAHRCCTRLALAVGDSTLVTKVAKNDCDFRAQRSPERM